MKKKLLFLMTLLAVSLFVMAEMRIFVYKKNNDKLIIFANQVDSIGFVKFDANGYEYVDLGLPSGTLWAKTDLGVISEYQREKFAWGEIESKEGDRTDDYKWYNAEEGIYTKYCLHEDYGVVDNIMRLELCDDVASVRWGGEWRIPTKEEWQELFNNCSYTYYDSNVIGGSYYILKSNINGATIKFYAGCYSYSNTEQTYKGTIGNLKYVPTAGYAYFYNGSTGSIYFKTNDRNYLYNVRPVLP